jgi:hypothetical protein
LVVTLAMGLGMGLAVLTAWESELAPGTQSVLWLAAAVTVSLSILAARTWPDVGYWLPDKITPKPDTERRLVPQGDWRTIGTVLGAMLVWLLIVAIAAPELTAR